MSRTLPPRRSISGADNLLKESLTRYETSRKFTCFVITGLVPVISIKKSTTLRSIGMAGTDPAMTSYVCRQMVRRLALRPSLLERLHRRDGEFVDADVGRDRRRGP